MKKNSLGISITVIAVFAFIALLPLEAFFQGSGEAQKLSNGETMTIEVELPGAYGEKISSLQISLEVTSQDGTSGNTSVLEKIENLSFSPDETIASKAKICEHRYHKNTGVLDIYIAGTQPLFSAEDKLTVGKVTATGKDGNGVDVYIKMVTDSFKVVRGNDLQTIMEDEATVRIAVAEEGEKPTQPEEPEKPTTPQETETPNPEDPIIDKTQLNEALDIAAEFVESDYTADSFALLKAAIEKAKAVMNDSNATKEEIEAVTEELLNVIGSLEPVSKNSVDNNSQPNGNNQNQSSTSAQTGDWSAIWVFVAMTVCSLSVIVMLVGWKKYRKQS